MKCVCSMKLKKLKVSFQNSVPADNTTSVTPAAEEAEGTEPTLQETTTLPQEFETATATTCPELQCLDGTCISLSQVNDGVLDCPEGLDEEDFGGLI
ncbi:hypothetical protein GWK47_002338 [Chionoecetes opilio]|uniref:Uncharacterized protein n=1 Tax=Chionoecetes opilio TaxID=41210 RepID=A0A8J4XQS2_CHIOP|nr:hypothetical protein GWK47_002338 [Chionoecetes opilio]